MAHLQLVYGDVKGKACRLETLLRGLGYSSLTFEGDGKCNKWGNTYIVTKNGRYFTNSTMSTAVNWGKMCLTEDEFLNEAIREIRLFEGEWPLDFDEYPEVTFENSPQEVELVLTYSPG